MQRLVAVEADLAPHVADLLDAAGIGASLNPVPDAKQGSLTEIAVPTADLQRARATLDLVLPGLLAAETEGPDPDPDTAPRGLAGRLIRRSDWATDEQPRGGLPEQQQGQPRRLLDGRAAFAEAAFGQAAASPDQPVAPDEDDFVPPPPPPLPRGDRVSRLAWLGAVGGPILMVLTALLDLAPFVAAAGLAGFVVGFGVLVARMPDRGRTDDGWDDGAVL